MSNPHGYEPNWTIEQHRDELIERLGEAIRQIAQQEATISTLRNLLEAETTNTERQAVSIRQLRGIVHLFCIYAPLSGDIALMIRASQPGGNEAHERANSLIAFYEHLNEAHDRGRKALEVTP